MTSLVKMFEWANLLNYKLLDNYGRTLAGLGNKSREITDRQAGLEMLC